MDFTRQSLPKRLGSWLLIFLASWNWPELLAWLTGAIILVFAGNYIIPLLPVDAVLAVLLSPDGPEIINTALTLLGLAVPTGIGLLIALAVYLLRKRSRSLQQQRATQKDCAMAKQDLMGNTSDRAEKYPVLTTLTSEAFAWIAGGLLLVLYFKIFQPIFPGNKLVPALLPLGLLFIVTVIGPIALAFMDWRELNGKERKNGPRKP